MRFWLARTSWHWGRVVDHSPGVSVSLPVVEPAGVRQNPPAQDAGICSRGTRLAHREISSRPGLDGGRCLYDSSRLAFPIRFRTEAAWPQTAIRMYLPRRPFESQGRPDAGGDGLLSRVDRFGKRLPANSGWDGTGCH